MKVKDTTKILIQSHEEGRWIDWYSRDEWDIPRAQSEVDRLSVMFGAANFRVIKRVVTEEVIL